MFFIPYGTVETERRQRFPYVTWLLVAINIVAFILQARIVFESGEAALASFLDKYAVIPTTITDGTPLEVSLLTAMFLHGGLLHIVSNMIFLLPFGDNVEDRLGHIRYLIFYLLSGIAGTLAYILFNQDSQIPLLGASGAIAGVLGGYLALHPTGRVKGFLFFFIILLPVTLPAMLFIGYWFITQLFSGVASIEPGETATGGVAFLAHVGGFIAGLLLAPIFAATHSKPKKVASAYTEEPVD